jgi:hypothetical protein
MKTKQKIFEFRLKPIRIIYTSLPGMSYILIFSFFCKISNRNDYPYEIMKSFEQIEKLVIISLIILTLFFATIVLYNSWNKFLLINTENSTHYYEDNSRKLTFKDEDILTINFIKNENILSGGMTTLFETAIITLKNNQRFIITNLLGDLKILTEKISTPIVYTTEYFPVMNMLL